MEFNTVNSTKETCGVGYQRLTERWTQLLIILALKKGPHGWWQSKSG